MAVSQAACVLIFISDEVDINHNKPKAKKNTSTINNFDNTEYQDS